MLWDSFLRYHQAVYVVFQNASYGISVSAARQSILKANQHTFFLQNDVCCQGNGDKTGRSAEYTAEILREVTSDRVGGSGYTRV